LTSSAGAGIRDANVSAVRSWPTVVPLSNFAPTKPPAGEPSRIGRIRMVTFDPGLNEGGRMPLRPS
jgi:hypothetical protein